MYKRIQSSSILKREGVGLVVADFSVSESFALAAVQVGQAMIFP